MKRNAFTLVELLVVIAIIGLLSTVAVVALKRSSINARNAKRKADLIQISKALELYYSDHNAYPASAGFMGHCGYGYYPDTDTPTSWIPGLVSGGYMAKLPDDPNCGKANPNSADNGCWARTDNTYIYISDGVHYRVMAYCTPEGPISAADPFYEHVNPQRTWVVDDDHAYADSHNWW
jgi:prepilin-type N-terminal cleavage/methylation domain-containing protein